MRDFIQILTKAFCVFFMASFLMLNVSAQSALRLVIPIVSSACFNGIDDDGDDLTDYPSDPDCTTQDDQSEHHLTATCTPSVTAVQL
jgi:hypothetical protein